MMWQMYQATGNELYHEIAVENEKMLDANLMMAGGLNHDNGFKWLPTSVANYRKTGNEESCNRGMLAADNLAGRFNLAGAFIRAWNDAGDGKKAGWVIIDSMMNLPLLYWASETTHDPRYRQIAERHADKVQEYFIRPDGSACHIVEFDPETGAFMKSHGGQGYGEGSAWTRGQAWAVYGFVLSYLHTNRKSYLETAKHTADYFIENIPESGLIPVDFRQPGTCTWEDSSAAAIAACGFLQLAQVLKDKEALKYHREAVRLLKILDKKRCNWKEEEDNLLEKCTAKYHSDRHEFAIIYGDYYFIEAIWKLTGQELFIW